MNLSPHFTLAEATFSQAAIRHGLNNDPSPEVLANMRQAALGLEQVRDLVGVPIHITSWLRVLAVNRLIPSDDTSDHVNGWAIDCIAPQYGDPLKLCRAVRNSTIKFDQMIFEGNWMHISFSPKMRGQVMTAKFIPGRKTSYVFGLPGV